MTDNNPYAAPKSQITSIDYGEEQYNESKWYSISGRIGRLRYLAYPMWFYLVSLIIAIVFGMIIGLLSVPLGISPEFSGNIVGIIAMIPFMFFAGIIYPIRRLNDLGKTGWLLLLGLIPIVNIFFYLYLTFARGDEGDNEYGEPPRPNKWYHWVLGLLLPTLFVIGILAALGLPAYKDYIDRNAAKVQTELSIKSYS